MMSSSHREGSLSVPKSDHLPKIIPANNSDTRMRNSVSIEHYFRLALAVCCLTRLLCDASAQTYQLTDLGAQFGGNSDAQGINYQGQVVGYWQTTGGVRAFLFSGGVMT